MKKILVVANWKCNPATLKGAKLLFNSTKKGIKGIKNVEVVICPPFVYLPILSSVISHQPLVKLGAQDCFWQEKGAFTGEISPAMLKNLGVDYVIIGHSERRKYQKETDEMINKKLKAALKQGLKPILCIENVSQIPKFLKKRGDFSGLTEKELSSLIIAYEPISAIGTNKPCSIDKAKKIRITIEEKLNKNIPILYGGSVNSENTVGYIREAGFSGLLLGGASLNIQEFFQTLKNLNLV